MKSYEIWLKGGGSLSGVMSGADAQRIIDEMPTTCNIVVFQDADGDTVAIRTVEIVAFAFRDEVTGKEVGYTCRT